MCSSITLSSMIPSLIPHLTYQVKMNALCGRAHFPSDKSHYTLYWGWKKEKSFVKFFYHATGFFLCISVNAGLQRFYHFLELHEMGGFYQNRISLLNITAQVFQKAFPCFLVEYRELRIRLTGGLRHMTGKASHADAGVDSAGRGVSAHFSVESDLVLAQFSHISQNGNPSSRPVVKHVKGGFHG